MKGIFTRRGFMRASLGLAGAASQSPAFRFAGEAPPPAEKARIKKGIRVNMLPAELSYRDRFRMAREVGFEQVEPFSTPDEREAEEIKKAADAAGIEIGSVANRTNWNYPLSSGDPAVVEKGIEGMKTSLRVAKLWGAEAVLLVPGSVTPQTSYREAWTRSQTHIRRLIPLAAELGVTIAIEEVWNNFLLSPLEFATYIDQFQSPYVKAYFDVGNAMLYGYPQDWIRTLGSRIVKIHIKDFKTYELVDMGEESPEIYQVVNLGEGSVDWAEVRRALAAIGYKGTVTVELSAHGEAYLRDVSKRVDKLLIS
jgi:hexulose-6-phosphate isomerase